MSVRDDLPAQIEAYHALPAEALGDEARAVFDELLDALERGEARAAEPTADGWRVNGWVKKGILLGFKLGRIVATEPAGPLSFLDKDTFLPRRFWFESANGNESTWDIPRLDVKPAIGGRSFDAPEPPAGWKLVTAPK